MAIQPATTSTVDLLLQRMHQGDNGARNQLIAAVYEPMEHLTQSMLRRFPGVRRWDESGDVLHSALVRLMRALEKVQPDSEEAVLALGHEQVRHEFLNRAHRYAGPAWRTTHDRTRAGEQDDREESIDLEKWAAFQEAVERLPTVEREVVILLFHHHWTQAELGELLHVTVRTVQHRLQSAARKLRAALVVE
jgi:RNA polymerase sigma-70 factor (ECF subfamily)